MPFQQHVCQHVLRSNKAVCTFLNKKSQKSKIATRIENKVVTLQKQYIWNLNHKILQFKEHQQLRAVFLIHDTTQISNAISLTLF